METYEDLFWAFYDAKNEDEIDKIIDQYPDTFGSGNWKPLGGNESNYGVVENQQSNPIAALVEKLTNSVDAILMRKCLELEIDPKSQNAPNSIDAAIERFFPEHKNWDLSDSLKVQAEDIQVVADSNPRDTANTSLIIYDNGEGQHPHRFEDTFLSLLRGNKNEIHFVQGKYNMGGSGAIVFCGKERYQLIASKRYTNDGKFGFTLMRRHPLTKEEAKSKKNTWYEYLSIDGQIPSFDIDELDLGLLNRNFVTGTIIKLYSYDTKGNRNIRRDMARSLNEFLYEPALPIYMVEKKSRYPKDVVLEAPIFGLKRQLVESDYVQDTFSEVVQDKLMGEMKVTVHVFKNRANGRSAKDTKTYVQREYFKNNMVVLFSMNGQVHGHYTTEFITRTLKYNLLRDSLLIHVDCTKMDFSFRTELFMASRDRLKQGEESNHLRNELAKSLRSGQLSDIYKQRKDSISVDGGEDNTLLQNFAENLPMNNDLRSLLSQTFKLESEDKPKKKKKSKPIKPKDVEKKVEFNPKRYPTFFNLDINKNGDTAVIRIPLGGSKTVQFDSDVESQYFDRVEDPGDMQIAVMKYTPNDNSGGNTKGTVNDVSDVFTVNRKSPQEGKIKIVFKPTDDVNLGDEIQVKVDLESSASMEGEFQEIFWVQVTEPPPKKPEKVSKPDEEDKIGLPNYTLVFQQAPDDMQDEVMTWDQMAEIYEMEFDDVMYPLVEGDVLDRIFINMDSSVFKNYKSKFRHITLQQEQDCTKQVHLCCILPHYLPVCD